MQPFFKTVSFALTTLTTLALASAAHAGIQPNSLFSDNAVLQRDCSLPVWGTAPAGDTITVEFAGQKITARSVDDKWMVRLKPLQAGGPFKMTISDSQETIGLTNILVGDVWIASGQSNMERPLGPCSWAPPVDNWQTEAAQASHPQLREFYVPKVIAYHPRTDAKGSWTVCSPETVKDYSAVGYFFGRDLQASIKVPVGILFSAWGGTVAEAWTSAGSLKEMPDFANQLSELRSFASNGADASQFEKTLDDWYRQNDPASTAQPAWNTPELDTAKWKQMNLPINWESAGLPGYDGIVWFRKEFQLPESWSGKDVVLNLGPIDDQDTTWVNGVRVGAMHRWDAVRRYPISGSILKPGRNVITIRVLDTGGAGGIDGTPDQMKLETLSDTALSPISLAGAWQYRDSVSLAKIQPVPQGLVDNPNVVTVLYNGMIAPLQPFPIKGVIWYQGESNNDRAKQYRTLFPLLIADWRAHWREGTFPFLFVQIAPCGDMRPELREAQFLTLNKSPNTAMAVITDAGDANNIHPTHKQVVGERLALAARALAYGENVEYSGPLFHSLQITNHQAILHFTHVGSGLMAKGGELRGFIIAGENKHFVPAHAEIQGNTVVVSSDQVTMPVAVRYGWSNVPDVNLYNREGLPASPFRTDAP